MNLGELAYLRIDLVVLSVIENQVYSLTTNQMYVPGQLSDINNVLIDIGTGYYVEMVSSAVLANKRGY